MPVSARLHVALPDVESLIALTTMLIAVAFNLARLYPEVAIQVPALNDAVMHLLVLKNTVLALTTGQNPTDPWMGTVPALGYPLFHYYQHLPYLPLAALYLLMTFATGGAVSMASVFNWTGYLLLSLFPLSIYWSMRRFGFSRLEAAFGGLASCLIATNSLYGLEYGSYLWRGSGMYTQLWGMFLLPLALAQCYITLSEGRGYLWSVLLVAATVLSHAVSGYVALGSIVLLALVVGWQYRAGEPQERHVWRSAARLLALLLLVALVISYFLLPFLQDRAYMNRSVWELQEKYDSYGAGWVLGALVKGQLLDYGRLPALTLLAAAGLAVCLWRWREPRYRVPVALALLWLLLYFGRPTWGVLLDLLPLSRDLHLHRLISGFHLGSIYLVGIGLALPWSWALASRDRRAWLVPIALTALLLLPVYRERSAYLGLNAKWMAESAAAYSAEQVDLAGLEETIADGPAGRVYAGLPTTWGEDYKVGAIPMYALFTWAGLDNVGFLYQALSLNSDVQVLFDDGRPEEYDLFNVRYVVTPVDWSAPSYYKTLGDFGRHRLYEIPTTGYFDLVGSDLAFAGEKTELYPAASAWLKSGLVTAKLHPAVYLGKVPSDVPTVPLAEAPQLFGQNMAAAPAARGRVIVETVEPNAYAADVEVARDSVLMLKATYHPNWHATIDGVETPTVMLMPSYVGVRVTPGAHHVRLEYRPGPLRGMLMALGLLTLVLVAVAERRRGDLSRVAGGLKLERPAASLTSISRGVNSSERYLATKASLRLHLPYVGAVLLIAMLAGLPLFQMQMMSGHDAPEYLTRGVEFYTGLQAGQIFPRWAPDLNFGYGEPFFSFNPPLVYYLMALFHGLGASFIAAQNLTSFVLLAAAGLGMYLLAAALFGRRAGLVAAAAYLLASYVLVALYVRQALADFAAFASIPFAFWGIYRYSRDGLYRFLLAGALALALLMLSSNPVGLMAVPALIAWAGWLGWRERSWRTLWRGLLVVLSGLALSAFFWLPAFAERGLVQTANLFVGYLNYRNHFVYPAQFVISPWGYGLSVAGPGDGMSFTLGPVHLVGVAAAVLLLWRMQGRGRRRRSWLGFFLVLLAAALFFASTVSQPIWDLLPLLQYLEFSWRFLTLAAFSSALLCGAVFASLSRGSARFDRWGPDVLLAAMLAGLLLWGLPKAQPEQFLAFNESSYTPQAIAERGIAVTTAGEYTPVWVQQRPRGPAAEPLTFVGGQGRVLASRLSGATQAFVVDAREESRLRLNTFYFPGWTLYVDGEERAVDYSSPQGVMEFTLSPGQHAVKLVFRDTPVRAWATRASLLTLLLMVVVAVAARVPKLPRRGRQALSL